MGGQVGLVGPGQVGRWALPCMEAAGCSTQGPGHEVAGCRIQGGPRASAGSCLGEVRVQKALTVAHPLAGKTRFWH